MKIYNILCCYMVTHVNVMNVNKCVISTKHFTLLSVKRNKRENKTSNIRTNLKHFGIKSQTWASNNSDDFILIPEV